MNEEITIRIWHCAECGGYHMDCPAMGENNNPDWIYEHYDEALRDVSDPNLELTWTKVTPNE